MQSAIDTLIRCQQLCESVTIRYAAELLAFDDVQGTEIAAGFRSDVLVAVQSEDYQRAIVGLDKFIADFLSDDPLMRIEFGGLQTMLRPTLVVLLNAQQNGLDVPE